MFTVVKSFLMFITENILPLVRNLPVLWYDLKNVGLNGTFASMPDMATGELSRSWEWKVPGICPEASGVLEGLPSPALLVWSPTEHGG